MASYDINLLRSATDASRELSQLIRTLHAVAWYCVLFLLFCGVVVGSLYVVSSARYATLEQQRTQLISRLRETTTKEGILVSLKQRSVTTSKALQAAKPWGKLFVLMKNVALPHQFQTLTVDDNGKVNITFDIGSIEEALTIVGQVISLHRSREVKNPELQELSMKEDGRVVMRIVITPVF